MFGSFNEIIKGFSLLRSNPRRLAYAFHRISKEKDVSNPFNRLSVISPANFDLLIRVLKFKAEFVDLNSLFTSESKQKFHIYIHFSFDDISKTFLEYGLPIIEKYQIPITIYPSVKNTDIGYSWRDKFYYILQNKELLDEYIKKMNSVFNLKKEIITENVYNWSKSSGFNHKKMEAEVIDMVLDRHKDEFLELIYKHRPYLNWSELKILKEHPLVTVGNHGFSHYNYNSLDDEEIEEDIKNSHRLIEERLGIRCRHFALPFGKINQKSYLIVDRILSDLGYETVAWGKNANNPYLPISQLRHYFRINATSNAVLNFVRTIKATLETQYSPLSGIPFSSRIGEVGQIAFEENVTLEEYKTFFRRLHPTKFHHQTDSYIKHLYDDNPFRKNRTPHLALKVNNEIFAIGSLFYIPFFLRGKRENGAYFCSWYRFPEFPNKFLRARKIYEEAFNKNPILGGHSPSPIVKHFFEEWDQVKVYKLKAQIKKSAKTDKKNTWVLTDHWDPRLQWIINLSHKNLLITVQRGADLYKWRIERYPLCRFYYLYPKIKPLWFAILCHYKNTAYISDFCLSDLKNREQITEMLLMLSDYGAKHDMKEIILETSNTMIIEVGKKYGFKLIDTFVNVYRYPGFKGRNLFWDEVHETQLSGDILPRFSYAESEKEIATKF